MPRIIPLLLLLLAPALFAETTANNLHEELARLDVIESGLQELHGDAAPLTRWVEEVQGVRRSAASCEGEQQHRLDAIAQALATLGEPVEGEDELISRKRVELQAQRTALDKTLARCRFVQLRGEQLLEQISAHQQIVLAGHLLARGERLDRLFAEGAPQLLRWLIELPGFVAQRSGLERLSPLGLIFIVVTTLGAFWSSLALRRWLRAYNRRNAGHEHFSAYFMDALRAALAHYLFLLLPSLGFLFGVGLLTYNFEAPPFILHLAWGLPIYALSLTVIQLLLCASEGGRLFPQLNEGTARSLARRLKLLVSLLFIAYLLLATLLGQSLPTEALNLARGALFTLIVFNMAWVTWLLGRIAEDSPLRWLRSLLIQVMVIALLAEWLAYRNLSLYILKSVIGSLAVIGLFVLLSRLFSELYDGLDDSEYPWQGRLRRTLAVADGANFPGLTWLRFFTSIGLWLGLLLAMLMIWEETGTGLERLRLWLEEGFQVGSLEIVPLRLLLSLLVMTLLIAFSAWLKRRLEKRWLLKTHMGRGAREAVVTFSGYIGFSVAVIIALGVAGVDFSNLALIAGALSVGIGFGLQNIVNNFVSGLILLIERPVKTGDWVVVGSTEGYVKQISIRSTIIQTFDRADVIVPNSELISGQVTNWMLRDNRGRVRIPVGVAYGSDADKVRRILMEVAYRNSQVITQEPTHAPKVYFLSFGESSLDFELRCFIDDIDNRMAVLSDMNFAIERAFREEGIEIPFPQRDLHVKEWPAAPAERDAPARSPWRRGGK